LPREEKIQLVEQLRDEVRRASALLLTDYRGLTVGEITDLRRKLGEIGADYKVVKNTLFKLATEGTLDDGLSQFLAGPTAVAFVHNDPIAPAKTLVDFMRDHKTMSIKGGWIEGRVLNAEQVQTLSRVPPRDVLVAQLMGAVQSPLTGLVGTLQSLTSNLVYTLQAVAAKKAA